jgi:glycerate kinase
MSLLVAAPDKFRGTATARQASEAIAEGASRSGWSVRQFPLSDGGEGFLDVLDEVGGQRHTLTVDGPLGGPVDARWLGGDRLAVIEMARASGLALVGGAAGNDPRRASSRGTGQLVVAAAQWLREQPPTGAGGHRILVEPGAASADGTILVGLGGSANSDGGMGAVEVIEAAGGLDGIQLIGACDVDVPFLMAAAQFGPQKGATDADVVAIEARLREVARYYEARFGVDVLPIAGAGAAGGLGGAIVALGGRLRSGYEIIAELTGFRQVLRAGELVVTGEGAFDASSLAGKTAASVLRDATALGIDTLLIAGRVSPEARRAGEAMGASVVALTEQFGEKRALTDTTGCIATAVAAHLEVLTSS